MKQKAELGNVGAQPIWLIALVPLVGLIWAAWYVAKFWF